MPGEEAEYAALRTAKELAERFPQFPFVLELKSTAFGVPLDQEWCASNPLVPILLSVEEARPVAEGNLQRATAMQAVERMLSLMPVEDRSPSLGGWFYDNVSSDADYGSIRINCTHTDLNGKVWASY